MTQKPLEQDDIMPRGWRAWLINGTLPIIAAIFLFGIVLTYIQLSRNYEQLVERTALQHAAVYSHTLDKFRALYATEVVETARNAGLLITHDYLTEPNAIPLPVTLTRELEREFAAPGSGTQTKMYSPMPFPWRQKEGGLKDDFAKDAWNALNQNPNEPFYRVESYDGVPSMRYAIAETLKPQCVSCHNDYEGSPKTDWKEGDVRGVLEVVYPLHNAETLSRRSIWETMGTLSPLLMIALALLGFATNQHRRWARTLQARVRAQEQALATKEENESLRTTIDSKSREQAQMLQSLPHGVLVLDADGEVQYANEKLNELLGGVFAEVWSGRSPRQGIAFVADTNDPYPTDELPSVMAMAGQSSAVMNLEWFDGERRIPLFVSATPIRNAHGEVSMAVVTVQDVSAQRQLEHTAQHAQRMQVLGRFAGEIAHDINNLLQVFTSSGTNLMRQERHKDHPVHVEGRRVYDAAQRGAKFTESLLALSRQRPLHMDVVNPNQVIDGMRDILRPLLKKNVRLTTELAPDLLNIRCESANLDQLLLNLAVNARDAMPEGGNLEISTQNVTIDASYAQAHELSLDAGDYVLLVVRDDGIGMDEPTRRRVFDPYYTTKIGGSGLGMSTCWNIVSKLGGQIRVESSPGNGARIYVYLPGVDEPVSDPASLSNIDLGPANETLIVVAEDDDVVRDSVVRELTAAGYVVLEAVDGRAALDLLETSAPDSVHLLVTDVVMPVMGGPELVQEAFALHPQLGVLFISGYTGYDDFPEGLGHADMLAKPFDPDTLIERVRNALARRANHMMQPEAP